VLELLREMYVKDAKKATRKCCWTILENDNYLAAANLLVMNDLALGIQLQVV